mmetsp:Transcript_39359/g.117084  ORF Transcript_39359/g.117084 Transcript_39359/m.117084 type:complete len:294 (-) Transcript_39359:845-1726(-)
MLCTAARFICTAHAVNCGTVYLQNRAMPPTVGRPAVGAAHTALHRRRPFHLPNSAAPTLPVPSSEQPLISPCVTGIAVGRPAAPSPSLGQVPRKPGADPVAAALLCRPADRAAAAALNAPPTPLVLRLRLLLQHRRMAAGEPPDELALRVRRREATRQRVSLLAQVLAARECGDHRERVGRLVHWHHVACVRDLDKREWAGRADGAGALSADGPRELLGSTKVCLARPRHCIEPPLVAKPVADEVLFSRIDHHRDAVLQKVHHKRHVVLEDVARHLGVDPGVAVGPLTRAVHT